MYQLHYDYDDEDGFRIFLVKLSARMQNEGLSTLLFHFFVDACERELIASISGVLHEMMPDAPYVLVSTNGNIVQGEHMASGSFGIMVVCDVFEDPDSRVEVLQYPLDYASQDSSADKLLVTINENPWVNAVEVLATSNDANVSEFCERACELPEHIAWYGGVAAAPDFTDVFSASPFVCSSVGAISNNSVIFVLYGGENLYFMTQATVGWKPLGLDLKVTSAKNSIIHELNGKPAFDVYHHYLKIDNDDDFFSHSLLFPLAFDMDGLTVLKTPVSVDGDRSLLMTSDLTCEHTECRIAYGDPAIILREVEQNAKLMSEFAPQAIYAFSCLARRLYWGSDSVGRETLPFNYIAPTFGFYTGGEFMRYGKRASLLNVTLVTVGLREGGVVRKHDANALEVDIHEFSRQMELVQTLTAFIGETSKELDEAYRQMELMAKTDGLTVLYNRAEIEARIGRALDDSKKRPDSPLPSLIMIDIDDFKKINDTYGHKAGDNVLKTIAQLFKDAIDDSGLYARAGRWGGEEFMVLLPKTDIETAAELAEDIRKRFSRVEFDGPKNCTISLGVVRAHPGESPDSFCMRSDAALYRAKSMGKNRVVIE